MDNPVFDFGRLDVDVRTLLCPTPNGRAENQDNYLLIDCQGQARYLQDQSEQCQQLPAWPSGHARLAVLDGMGGHSNGRQAAELTVQGLLQIPATSNLGALGEQLERLHAQLRQRMHRDGNEPGCTLTLIEVPPSGPARLFHVGDSRLYSINDDCVEYLTVDHIPATRFAMMRLINRDEWLQQTHVNPGYQISQAFILGNSLNMGNVSGNLDAGLFELHDGNLPSFLQGLGDRRELYLRSDQTYMLASDGLWHLQQPKPFIDQWPEVFQDDAQNALPLQLDDLFQRLQQVTQAEAQTRGDNCTAIAFRLKS
jgi:serine/threonine protein phosphatase PrpC